MDANFSSGNEEQVSTSCIKECYANSMGGQSINGSTNIEFSKEPNRKKKTSKIEGKESQSYQKVDKIEKVKKSSLEKQNP